MSAIILDTLEYAAKLKAGGFTDQQAETRRAPWRTSLKNNSSRGTILTHTKLICGGILKCCGLS